MAIMKKVEFDGKKTFGFVDIGSGVTNDGAPAATQALVFMVVCVNGSWKVPIGFFFIHGMTGKEKANLVRECLHQLGQIGIKVISLTCDGPSCHFAMLSDLGASMDPENLDPSFPHPSSGHKIFVILDVCHMLKLLRNIVFLLVFSLSEIVKRSGPPTLALKSAGSFCRGLEHTNGTLLEDIRES
ncbi:THAP domain-containing protein 9 [Plakobranchus ocellatus]|uniref:THAP domain-containing protein 9 n=1 Tax=Plakobranchus ocellatus TaxID=259542 RepID=A0AAV3Z9W1_9GAST|nr:THAP domain-containing protein 9 [Plakobranchus ocellatus]